MTWFRFGVTVAILTLVLGTAVAIAAYCGHERDLDRRCAAAGGRRVDIGVHEKLCFTEDWRWKQL